MGRDCEAKPTQRGQQDRGAAQAPRRHAYSAHFKLRVVQEALLRPASNRIKPTCRDHPGIEPVQLRKWIRNAEALQLAEPSAKCLAGVGRRASSCANPILRSASNEKIVAPAVAQPPILCATAPPEHTDSAPSPRTPADVGNICTGHLTPQAKAFAPPVAPAAPAAPTAEHDRRSRVHAQLPRSPSTVQSAMPNLEAFGTVDEQRCAAQELLLLSSTITRLAQPA